MSEQRFFISHGQIHDRFTGRHVTTDETMFMDDERGNPMDKRFQGQADIIDACCLLNSLEAEAKVGRAYNEQKADSMKIGTLESRSDNRQEG